MALGEAFDECGVLVDLFDEFLIDLFLFLEVLEVGLEFFALVELLSVFVGLRDEEAAGDEADADGDEDKGPAIAVVFWGIGKGGGWGRMNRQGGGGESEESIGDGSRIDGGSGPGGILFGGRHGGHGRVVTDSPGQNKRARQASPMKIRGSAVARRCPPVLSALLVPELSAELGLFAELFFDAEELVVLGDAIGTGGRAGLDLAAVGGNGNVGDGGVFGFAGAV